MGAASPRRTRAPSERRFILETLGFCDANAGVSHIVETLIDRIRSRGVGQNPLINPFWQNELGALAKAFSDENFAYKGIRKRMGYNTRKLAPDTGGNRDQRPWPVIMRAVDTGDVSDLGKIRDFVGQLSFLKRHDLLDEFVDWSDERGLACDLNLGRYWWYRRKLLAKLEQKEIAIEGAYLEVGAGSGRMPLMYEELGIAKHFIIVDLPEMLLNVSLLLAEERPDTPVRLGEVPDLSAPPGFWLLETSEISMVPAGTVGIAVNINSFMEMDGEVRDFYIDEFYRILRPGGIFFNVNRRQSEMSQRDGSTFDSNPLLYPYRGTDRVIDWEIDDCQMCCKSSTFFSPASWAVLRIAQVV